jgi:hypothetical protein
MSQIPIVDPSRGIDQPVQWIEESEWPVADSAGRLRAERFYQKMEADIAMRRRIVESEVIRRRVV